MIYFYRTQTVYSYLTNGSSRAYGRRTRSLTLLIFLVSALSVATTDVARAQAGILVHASADKINSLKMGTAQARGSGANAILSAANATLVQAYPTAYTKGMRQYYVLTCTNCNLEDVAADLVGTSDFDGFVDDAAFQPATEDCADCPNPASFNDPVLLGHGNEWQIESIGANCA